MNFEKLIDERQTLIEDGQHSVDKGKEKWWYF